MSRDEAEMSNAATGEDVEETETRHGQIRARCESFHREHPEVWEMFVRYTFEKIRQGFENYSADAVFHRIRWEMSLPTYVTGKEFKLNDHFTAFYARRFHKMYPSHAGFFRTKVQSSKTRAQCNLPELTPRDFEAITER